MRVLKLSICAIILRISSRLYPTRRSEAVNFAVSSFSEEDVNLLLLLEKRQITRTAEISEIQSTMVSQKVILKRLGIAHDVALGIGTIASLVGVALFAFWSSQKIGYSHLHVIGITAFVLGLISYTGQRTWRIWRYVWRSLTSVCRHRGEANVSAAFWTVTDDEYVNISPPSAARTIRPRQNAYTLPVFKF